jgi:hypothetical protein
MPPAPSPSTSHPVALSGAADGFTLNLSWLNPVGPGTPTSLLLDVSGSINATIPLGVTESFHYAGVPQGVYTFSVRAVTAQGISAPSNPVTLSFPGYGAAAATCAIPPATPQAFNAVRDGNTVIVTWQPPVGGAASYVLHVTGSYVGTFTTAALGLSGMVPPGAYTVRVQAVNACGASAASQALTVTVP